MCEDSSSSAGDGGPLTQSIEVSQEQLESVLGPGVTPWLRHATETMPSIPREEEHPIPPATPGQNNETTELDAKTERDRIKEEGRRERDRVLLEQEEREFEDTQNFQICRRHFIAGCFGLPFLHFITVIYFYPEWFGRNIRIQKYIWLSLIIGLVQSFIWILWFVVFQISDHLDHMSILNSNSSVVGHFAR